MKKMLLGAAVILISGVSLNVNAQKIKLTSGDLGMLAAQKEINTEFVYDGMAVGKFKTEEEYIAKKTEEYNKKESGKGDSWAKSWKADREARFEPKFNELFGESSGITSGGSPNSKYTMIVKTIFTEPGFNVGIWRENASLNLEVTIVETANKGKALATISVMKALGRTFGGFDFDTGTRLGEAYADAGKALGKFVKSKSK